MNEEKVKKTYPKAVSWCFTDFNEYTITNGYAKYFEEFKDMIRGMAWGIETCPTTGKKHNQGFIQFYSQHRTKAVQRMLGSKCHLETMKGSILDNEKYCSKEGVYTTLGYFCKRGFRTNMHNIKDDLMEGASEYEIMDNYTSDFCRYHGGINKMKSLIDKKRRQKIGYRKPEVKILFGDAGVGKTREIYDKHGYENVFKVSRYNDEKFMFNGYENEEVLLLDDFYGGIQYSYLLQLLDGYPMDLNVKNGIRYNFFKKVYITSNKNPHEWYKSGIKENFIRRINECLEVSKGNTDALTHSSYELYEKEI